MVIIISGAYIKELRKNLGMSQQELADRAGVTQEHIAKIESEKVDARLSTINKIISMLESNQKKSKCNNFMTRCIISVSSRDKVSRAIQLMKRHNISQLPVIDSGVSVGSIMESTLIKNMEKDISGKRVRDIMEGSFPVINAGDSIETARSLLGSHEAVLLSEKGKISGLITKSNLLGVVK